MAQPPNNSSGAARLAGRVLARYVALVKTSSTVIVEPADARERIIAAHPFIFAMWHGQFMMPPALHTGYVRVSAIVARHGDAAVLGQFLSRFDIDLVHGAGAGTRLRDRGGASALRAALRLLKGGSTFALTADVPPGPARKAGVGIVTLAQMSGRPIVPFAAATSRYVALKTWSRMTINLPYGKLAYVVGEPIFVPRDADEAELERYRLKVEHALNGVTSRAYQLAGADPARATPPGAADLTSRPLKPGLGLKTYRALTNCLRPAAPYLLGKRERQGKEDPARRNERFGIASAPRLAGPLMWIHAASVGETNAVLPLMSQLKEGRPGLNFVLTTGTVTSAALASRRLPAGSTHQYVPLDVPDYARRFLDHWRPDVAVFTESEIWPNLILETSARDIPLALVNARMSARSQRRWMRYRSLAAPLFSCFDLILAQNERLQRQLILLGARRVETVGNLKIDSPPPPVDAVAFEQLRKALQDRPRMIAASTHQGEDEIVASAHRKIAREISGFCTIIAPRHPERGTTIAERLKGLGLVVAQRSLGALPDAKTEVYIADTIGELGTLYALCPVAFVGGSLVNHGGQNPIEAIGHGAAVLTGPYWRNFRDIYRALIRHNGAIEVSSNDELATAVLTLSRDSQELERVRTGGKAAMRTLSGALERTIAALEPFLPAKEDIKRAS